MFRSILFLLCLTADVRRVQYPQQGTLISLGCSTGSSTLSQTNLHTHHKLGFTLPVPHLLLLLACQQREDVLSLYEVCSQLAVVHWDFHMLDIARQNRDVECRVPVMSSSFPCPRLQIPLLLCYNSAFIFSITSQSPFIHHDSTSSSLSFVRKHETRE